MSIPFLRDAAAPESVCASRAGALFRRDATEVAPLLQDLRARGHRIALDGLGTSCSSLASWPRLPINTLKIVHSRVREDNPRSAGIITAALAFGKSSGLDVVIDGVDSAAALPGVLRRGASMLQGSAVASPMPLTAVDTWFRSSSFGAISETAPPLARTNRQG